MLWRIWSCMRRRTYSESSLQTSKGDEKNTSISKFSRSVVGPRFWLLEMSLCDLHYYPWWCGDQCCVADINNILNPTYNIIWWWVGCHKIWLFYKWNSSYVECACNKYLLNIYNSIPLLLWSITSKWGKDRYTMWKLKVNPHPPRNVPTLQLLPHPDSVRGCLEKPLASSFSISQYLQLIINWELQQDDILGPQPRQIKLEMPRGAYSVLSVEQNTNVTWERPNSVG